MRAKRGIEGKQPRLTESVSYDTRLAEGIPEHLQLGKFITEAH